MTFNNDKYRDLLSNGMPHGAAKILADSDTQPVQGGPVVDAKALKVASTIPGTYSQAEVQNLRDDVQNLRGTVMSLLTALRSAGVIK